MSPDSQHEVGDLLIQAAAGSTAAQSGLAQASMAAGAKGAVRQIEALIAAEAWTRLAAATGESAGAWSLIEVLLTRMEFEIERCSVGDARWYENEARRVLKPLADAGDEHARRALDEIGPEIDCNHQGPTLETQRYLTAAARGDLAALGALHDEAVAFLNTGADPGEALTVAEAYARLGVQSGNADHFQRLAGVMLKRAEYEYQNGNTARAEAAFAEGTFLLGILVDTGSRHLAPWLQTLVRDPAHPAVVYAIQHCPTILFHILPQGIC